MSILNKRDQDQKSAHPKRLLFSTSEILPGNKTTGLLRWPERNLTKASMPFGSLFISVREKIGFDQLVIPEHNLSDENLWSTLEQWKNLLAEHHIIILFTEYPVDHRARYRFLSEVFFNMALPLHPLGMQFCFVYDQVSSGVMEDFNSEVVRTVMSSLLSEQHINTIQHLNKRVRLNGFENLSEPELYYIINRYNERYEGIINRNISLRTNKLRNGRLVYTGEHETNFCYRDHCQIMKGNWQLEMMPVNGAWLVVDIQVEGLFS